MRQSHRAVLPVPQAERDALLQCFGALRSVRYAHPEIVSAAVLDALDAVQQEQPTTANFYSDNHTADLAVSAWLVMLDAVNELRRIQETLDMKDPQSASLVARALTEFGLTQTPAWFHRYEAFVKPGWGTRRVDKSRRPLSGPTG